MTDKIENEDINEYCVECVNECKQTKSVEVVYCPSRKVKGPVKQKEVRNRLIISEVE